MDKYRIVETLTENQVSDLMDLYKNEFWCDKRRREDVVQMLAATDVIIGLVDEGDRWSYSILIASSSSTDSLRRIWQLSVLRPLVNFF